MVLTHPHLLTITGYAIWYLIRVVMCGYVWYQFRGSQDNNIWHFMVFGMITAGIHQVYLGIMIWNLGIDIDLITVVFDGIWYRFLTCYICRWYLMAF
jgi:hypothetical protein